MAKMQLKKRGRMEGGKGETRVGTVGERKRQDDRQVKQNVHIHIHQMPACICTCIPVEMRQATKQTLFFYSIEFMPLYSVFPSECKTALSYGVFVVSSWETCNRGRFWTKDLAHQMGPASAPGDQSFNKGMNINQGMEGSVRRATKQFNE